MAVVAVTSIDISMSIKKRLDICQRALLGCFKKSIIELLSLLVKLLVRCHWCLSLMFAQYRLNQSNQIKCATICDSHEIEYRGIPNTLNRATR